MTKIILLIVGLIIGIAGGGGGVYYWLQRQQADPGHSVATSRDSHSEHEDHEGHDEHEGKVKLSSEAIKEYGIEVTPAAGGSLETVMTLPGEIALNADRVAHVVPRVNGIIREVRKAQGETVKAGEVLVVMESRELAESKAADLSAEARLKLAESNHTRVEGLWKDKIATEQQFQEASHALEEARIVHREAIAKLHALGLTHNQVNAVQSQDDADFSRYELKAPFDATVVDKHAALGEVHDSTSDVYVLADLSSVWVDITVYAQDAARVQIGSHVRVWTAGPDGQRVQAEGSIAYISPLIRESTRTGLARAVIANEKGFWKPGLFVTAEIVIGQTQANVLVPNEAIQTIEAQPVVFVAEDGEFEKRPVVVERSNPTHSEVKSGLRPGEQYVSKGSFILKAELAKGSGEHEH